VRFNEMKRYIGKVSYKTLSSTLKALESAAVGVEEKHREALQYSKRRFRDAQETAEMIGAALSERFTNAISPAAVQTMSLLVGDESLQFRFVGSRTNPTAVPHAVTYNAKTKAVNAASGILQHLTLGLRTVSAQPSPSVRSRTWPVSGSGSWPPPPLRATAPTQKSSSGAPRPLVGRRRSSPAPAAPRGRRRVPSGPRSARKVG